MDSLRERIGPEPADLTPVSTQAQPQSGGLFELYHQYFDVVPADTRERRNEAYRLRYQVYCVENPFENPAEHVDGRERDIYDEHSVHSLLIHRSTGALAGTVRLVLPKLGRHLPIRHVCNHPLLGSQQMMPPNTTAEISRFAVSKQFRRRATDKLGVDHALLEQSSPSSALDRRLIPHITLGLMKAIVQMSWEHGITHWSAVMEPALLRLIGRLGIDFSPLGPLVDHHGMRQPCHGDIDEILTGMKRQRLDAWELITDGGRYWGSHRFDVSEVKALPVRAA
jgi:N-acyl amino acid synthase of PEP-CTERM/exosortase system